MLLVVNTLFLTIGVCAGSFWCITLSGTGQDAISQLFGNFQRITQATQMDYLSIFCSALLNVVQFGLFLWLCGVTRLGLPVAPVIVGLKGFVCGFSVASLIKVYAQVGLLVAAVGILPQMLIVFPVIEVFSVASMNQAIWCSRDTERTERRKRFVSYCIFCSLLLAVLAGCALFESYISPHLMLWALGFAQ